MYRSSFTFDVDDLDEEQELEVNLADLVTPLLPSGLKWEFRHQQHRLQLIVEWPDKETALEWLKRQDVIQARYRLDAAMGWTRKGRRSGSGRRW